MLFLLCFIRDQRKSNSLIWQSKITLQEISVQMTLPIENFSAPNLYKYILWYSWHHNNLFHEIEKHYFSNQLKFYLHIL